MSSPPPVLQVAVVEDQPLFQEMLVHLLRTISGFKVRSARTLEEAAQWDASELHVALLDFELPDGTGLQLGRRLQRSNPKLGIVLLSAVDRVRTLLEVDERERWSYLSKKSATSAGDLVRAVRAAAAGRFMIDPHIITRRTPRTGSRLDSLSARQYLVLTLLAEGLTNQAIAAHLALSVNSVNNHVNAVYAALGLSDSTRNPRVSAVRVFLEDSV